MTAKTAEKEYHGIRIHAASGLHEACAAVLDELQISGGAEVLDLGAGEGAFTQRLLDQGYRVTAVEKDPSRFNLPVRRYCFDLNQDFEHNFSHRFDLIVALEIIEHLSDPRHFLRNCLSLLKEGGHLLLSTPNVESWFSRLRFLRDGRFLWFEQNDYEVYGHITPVFSWQIGQICQELGMALVDVRSTEPNYLRARLGGSLLGALKNKITYLIFLCPFMSGHKHGEVGIYLMKRSARDSSGSYH